MLRKLQEDQKAWVQHNFPNRLSWMPAMGTGEEIGELAENIDSTEHLKYLMISMGKLFHAQLKTEQGIRVSELHEDKIKDSIADIIIFLADYCSAKGFDLESIVQTVWDEVKQRDWKKYPVNGLTK